MRWTGRTTLSLSFAFLVVLAVPARAQGDLRIETKGGVDAAHLSGDITTGAHDKRGFTGGFAFEWRLNPTFSLQSEIAYASKGNVYDSFQDPMINGVVYPGTFHWELLIDYVEVPALVRVGRSFGLVRPSVVAGPVLGFKVKEKFALKGPAIGDLSGNNLAGRVTDLGATGGAGLEIGPADGCLTLEARFQQSLMDIQKSTYPGDFKNTELRFTAGWKMRWPSVFRVD